MNAQNEAKVKKLGEEITSMKAAKVKLIKTMREESDKVINKLLYYIYQGWGAGAGCFWLLGAGAGAA